MEICGPGVLEASHSPGARKFFTWRSSGLEVELTIHPIWGLKLRISKATNPLRHMSEVRMEDTKISLL